MGATHPDLVRTVTARLTVGRRYELAIPGNYWLLGAKAGIYQASSPSNSWPYTGLDGLAAINVVINTAQERDAVLGHVPRAFLTVSQDAPRDEATWAPERAPGLDGGIYVDVTPSRPMPTDVVVTVLVTLQFTARDHSCPALKPPQEWLQECWGGSPAPNITFGPTYELDLWDTEDGAVLQQFLVNEKGQPLSSDTGALLETTHGAE